MPTPVENKEAIKQLEYWATNRRIVVLELFGVEGAAQFELRFTGLLAILRENCHRGPESAQTRFMLANHQGRFVSPGLGTLCAAVDGNNAVVFRSHGAGSIFKLEIRIADFQPEQCITPRVQ